RIDTYGLGMAIVMKYTVDEINANQFLLPGIQLGYEIHDTCRQSAVIVRPTMYYLAAKSNNMLSVECNYTNYETRVSAVIGPYGSEMVSVIGKLLGFFLMPQISYGATSDKFSDNILYPSFFRTVPSDKGQVEAMILLLLEFNWNWVAVVGSDEEYGQRGVQDFSKVAANRSICVAYQGLIPVYTDPEPVVKTIISNINSTKANVVIVFSLPNQAEIFFQEVIRTKLKGVWIGSTSWGIHNQVTSLPDIQTVGTILAFTDITQSLDHLSAYTHELLTKVSEEHAHTPPMVQISAHPPNPCPKCWNLSPANISLVTQPVVQRTAFSVYAAIYSVAQALHNLLQCNSTACMKTSEVKIYPWKLLKVLRNTSVNISGTQLKFDTNGNPNVGYNLVKWVWEESGVEFTEIGSFDEKLDINTSLFTWHTANSEVPESTCSAACGEGQVHRVKGFHSCCFDCIDCLPGTYQRDADDIQCTPCPPRQWSLKRSTRCTDPTYDYLSWDTPEALLLTLAIVLVVLLKGAVVVLFLKHRGTVLVAASGGTLSFVVLLGLMGACLSLLLFLGQPGDTVCRLQLPLVSIFQTVPLCIIMSISLQIFFVSEFPTLAASYLHVLRGPGTWLLLLICCAVQAGICGWQDIEKLQKEQEELHRNLGICKNFSRLHRDSEDTKTLRALLEEEDMIHAALVKEKDHQQELDKEALTHFSEQMTKNSQLRKELQTLHVEQMRFQQLRTRLEKVGAEMAEAQSKMILLKEKAVKDLTQYNAEIKDLERLIAHECHLKEFMTTKCNERSVGDQCENPIQSLYRRNITPTSNGHMQNSYLKQECQNPVLRAIIQAGLLSYQMILPWFSCLVKRCYLSGRT
ncbi:unnamed protein product, partial [Tetraodon nigroviridis]